jgi:hypothetical protein
MEVVYKKWHNNYDFILGQKYKATLYKKGWILIDGVLYREECFEKKIPM